MGVECIVGGLILVIVQALHSQHRPTQIVQHVIAVVRMPATLRQIGVLLHRGGCAGAQISVLQVVVHDAALQTRAPPDSCAVEVL